MKMRRYIFKILICIVILSSYFTISTSTSEDEKDISFSVLRDRIHELEREKDERNEQLKDLNVEVPDGDFSAARVRIQRLEQENIALQEQLKNYEDLPEDDNFSELRAKIKELEDKNNEMKDKLTDYQEDVKNFGS